MNDSILAPAVQRTIQILEMLLCHPQGVTASEMLLEIDVSRSSLFAFLNTLKALGYVEQAQKRGRYRAGPRLLAWRGGAGPALDADLQSAFYQEAGESGLEETLALVVPTAADEALVLAQVESPRQVRSVLEFGQRLPVSSAAGRIFQSPLAPEIKERGFCLAPRGDSLEIAFPVCRDGVLPSAALLLSAPAFRWDDSCLDEFLPLLREISARLSYRIGAPNYSPWQTEARTEVAGTLPLDEAQQSALLKAPWAARLACVRPDGAPHVVPVWHEWDGRVFRVLAWRGSRWGDYLAANPQVSLTVDEPWLPFRRISVKGTAQPEFEADDPSLNRLLARLSRRYLGHNLAATLAPQVERSFLITPLSLRGWQGIS
jgi:DNA-binding IclR family transcriptional regulator